MFGERELPERDPHRSGGTAGGGRNGPGSVRVEGTLEGNPRELLVQRGVNVEIWFLQINSSGRGSKFLCIVCYKKTTDLKKHLTGFHTKARLVSLNQTILQAQISAFPEPESDDGE